MVAGPLAAPKAEAPIGRDRDRQGVAAPGRPMWLQRVALQLGVC
jgi:hypothetical protein